MNTLLLVAASIALTTLGFAVSTACTVAIDRESADDDRLISDWVIGAVIVGAIPAAVCWDRIGLHAPRTYDLLFPNCSVR